MIAADILPLMPGTTLTVTTVNDSTSLKAYLFVCLKCLCISVCNYIHSTQVGKYYMWKLQIVFLLLELGSHCVT